MVIPLVLTDTVEPAAKFVPVKVTGTVAPCEPLLGATESNVGAGEVTLNGKPLLVPLVVVTVTVAAPSDAVEEIVKVAVIMVLPTMDTLLTAMPGLVVPTVAPKMKFVPVIVTGTTLPAAPELGLMFVRLAGLPDSVTEYDWPLMVIVPVN
jgi:hypothetical protein